MKDERETARDKTLNQPPKFLEGAKFEERSVNRLLKIHEAAQQELRDLEADFQYRLQESILQTEVKLKQRFTDEQEQKIKQTEDEVRKATTSELLTRFEDDFQKLSSEFAETQRNAIAAAENAAQLRLKEVLEEAERIKGDLEADFQSRLQESILQTEAELKQRFADEQEQKIRQTEDDVRKATTRELLTRFEDDFQKLSNEFEERQKSAIAAAENAAQLRLKEVLEEAERYKKDLEADFQVRLQESILQTEVELKQRFAEEQEQQIKRTEDEVRKGTRELLTQFEEDVQKLSSEFEERQKNAIAAAENAAQLRLEEVLEKAERAKQCLEADFQVRLRESILQTEVELKQRFGGEQEQKIKETEDEVRKVTTRELLTRFEDDFQKLSSEFEERQKNAIAAAENAAQLRLEEVLEEAERAKQDLEADFQVRLRESILQTEVELKQRFGGEQEQKIKETEDEVRKATTRELLTRFEDDFQKLSSEFEERQKNAIAAAENAAQLRLEEVLEEAERAKQDLEADFQVRLRESILQTEVELKQRFAGEQAEKIKETEDEVRKATTRELLTRFEDDFQKLSSEFEERQKSAIAAAETAAQLRLEEVLEQGQRAKQDLEADFQVRLRESILQTEVELKQRFAGEQEQKIKETEDEVRKATTRELLTRFEDDFQKLSSEFEERQKNAIAAAENAAQLSLEEVLEQGQRAKQDLEADFQVRLRESILQTEVELKQRFAGEQEQKIKETEDEVRKATTRELLAQFDVDFQKFESAAGQWEIERQQLHDEITKLGELETKLSEVSHEKARLQEELRVAECDRNTERESLRSEMKQSREELLSRFKTEREQLKTETIAATEAAAGLVFAQKFAAASQDFQRREQEIHATANQRLQRTTDEFDGERKEFQQRIAALEEGRARSEEELRDANARRNTEGQCLESAQAQRGDTRDVSDAVKAEITRIESRLGEISGKIEGSSTDLATQIRFNRERSELEAYLKGLRYSLG